MPLVLPGGASGYRRRRLGRAERFQVRPEVLQLLLQVRVQDADLSRSACSLFTVRTRLRHFVGFRLGPRRS